MTPYEALQAEGAALQALLKGYRYQSKPPKDRTGWEAPNAEHPKTWRKSDGKPSKRRAARHKDDAPPAPEVDEEVRARHAEEPLHVVGYYDAFKITDAPFVWEDRTSASGRTYSVKVYLPEAYTDDYMHRSHESGQRIRWGVRLSDGRTVSRDGLIRIRYPDRWEAIRKELTRLRGDRREARAAELVWESMSAEERDAMLASVPWDEYVDERGVTQATQDLEQDLRASGSILGWAAPIGDMVRDAYARRYLGGPATSDRIAATPWATFARWSSVAWGTGDPGPDADGFDLPLAVKNWEGRPVLARWVSDINYWARTVAPYRPGEVAATLERLRARLLAQYPNGSAEDRAALSSIDSAHRSSVRNEIRSILARATAHLPRSA